MNSSKKTGTYAPDEKLWTALGSSLLFLDTLGGALFLPVLPALVGALGVKRPASVASWVGFLVGAYYASRSGLLGAVRLFSSSSSITVSPPKPSPLRVSALLVLSAAAYLTYGLAVDRRTSGSGLWCLAAIRVVAGLLAAAHQALACGCLDHAGPASSRKSRGESAGALGGLVVGFALAGSLFNPDHSRPALLLCLGAAVVHAPSCIVLVFLWQRDAGRGGAVVDSSGYTNVHGTPGGSDAEVELIGRPPWGARDSFDGKVEGGGVAAAAAAPAPAPAGGTAVAGNGEEIIVPGRYLRGCKGDVVEAERRWRLTLDWRARERVDEVLHEPQPHFDVIKRHYPHFIHRRARNGCPVWIELPGRIDLPAIRSGGVSPEALQRHYVFVTEYLWSMVEPDFENGQAVTVLDVQGLGMRDLAGEALGFVKQATAIVQDHYVERSNRMFIVNAPSYFSLIWRVIRPMLNERTQAKIGIINTDRKKIADALLDCIAPEDLPRQYGGTCPLDLGESKEEADMRAYVRSITPSLAPPPAPPCDNDGAEDDEVEVDLRTSPATAANPLHSNGGVGCAAGAVGEARNEVSELPVLGDTPREGGQQGSGDRNRPPGAARRALGTMTGALAWAGGKLAWRRSTVAHLGDENGFEYDADQQRWVLRDRRPGDGVKSGAGGGGRKDVLAGASSGEGGRGGRGGGREHSPSLRPQRKRSMGSSTSEEMTVLAIQAAHHSLTEVGTKLSPVPSDVSAVPGVTAGSLGNLTGKYAPHEGSSRLKYLTGSRDPRAANGAGGHPLENSRTMDRLEVSCLCMRPFGRRASRPDFVSVVYATSTAVREALPLWLLAGGQGGGLDASCPQIGLAFAAGVLLAEAGRAAASAGWFGACLGKGSAKDFAGGARLLRVVRARLVMVAVLGLLYLLSRLLSPSTMPSAVLWLAVTAVVAVNHASLALSAISVSQRANFGGSCGASAIDGHYDEERTRAASSVSSAGGGVSRPPQRTMVISASTLVGDVVGSAGGPLLLALVLCTGWAAPFDTSWWLVLCFCGDLWLSMGSRRAEPRHPGLHGADDGGVAEVEEVVGRFAQFV